MPCREYTSYEEVVEDYGRGALHPGDLKPALAKALNAILQPVRDHFAADERAKKLLAQVRSCSSLPLPPMYCLRFSQATLSSRSARCSEPSLSPCADHFAADEHAKRLLIRVLKFQS